MTAFLLGCQYDVVSISSAIIYDAGSRSIERNKEVVRCRVRNQNVESYQVMTLSAIGDAETPAGGSVCIRCSSLVSKKPSPSPCVAGGQAYILVAYLEVAHQTAAGCGGHGMVC